jgi:hypothetical protein
MQLHNLGNTLNRDFLSLNFQILSNILITTHFKLGTRFVLYQASDRPFTSVKRLGTTLTRCQWMTLNLSTHHCEQDGSSAGYTLLLCRETEQADLQFPCDVSLCVQPSAFLGLPCEFAKSRSMKLRKARDV